jgi:HK97 family phage major capsid protein
VGSIPYNNLTSRTDAAALIPEEVSSAMLAKATDESAVLRMFRRVPVGRNQVRFPVLSALPVGYFVNGDTGLKQTTEINWTNKYLNIEEIATILPVPDNVVADMDVNIWDEAMPYLVEAFYRTLDAAAMFGTNAPGTWPTNVSAAALAAGNSLTGNAAATAGAGYGDLDAAYALLDADGYDPTGIIAATTWKGRIRPSRDSTGQRLDPGRANASLTNIDGLDVAYPMRGLWPSGSGGVYALVGDWSQFVVGVRQDITMKVLDQAVITDNTGAIIYNLAQQDMTAIRLTFRVGWQVANIINFDQPVEGSRYPVARILIP